MKEFWWVLWIIVLFVFMAWAAQHQWECPSLYKGELRVDSFSRQVKVCDGKHWVPYVVEKP